MFDSLGVVSSHLLSHLLASLGLLFKHHLVLGGSSLVLLLFDESLDGASLCFVLVILEVEQLTLHLLLLLGSRHIVQDPLLVSLLVVLDLGLLLLFLSFVQQRDLNLLIEFELLSHLLLGLVLHVPPALIDDITGLLPRLLYFLEGSGFFLLQ